MEKIGTDYKQRTWISLYLKEPPLSNLLQVTALLNAFHTRLGGNYLRSERPAYMCKLLFVYFSFQWSKDKDRFFREIRQILRHRCLLSEIRECDDNLKCLR